MITKYVVLLWLNCGNRDRLLWFCYHGVMTKNIVVVGHACIDHNTVDGKTIKTWGSPLLYITKYFTGHYPDVQVYAVAPHGTDFMKYAYGIDLYPEPTNHPTMIYRNVVVDGTRTQYCLNTSFTGPPPLNKTIIGLLEAADIVFLAPLTPQYGTGYVRQLMAYAVSATKILIPQGYLRHISDDTLVTPRKFAEASDLLLLFDVVVLSDEDIPNALETARAWKQSSPDTAIIVTENSRGADLVGTDTNQHFPTEPVAKEYVLNPIGCGDVFSAAMAYEYSQSKDLGAAIRAGHQAAHKSLTAPGGRL